MGTSMNQGDTNITIPKDKLPAATEAIKIWARGMERVRWVSDSDIEEATDFAGVIKALCWEVETDEFGNINHLSLADMDRSGDEDKWLRVLAPFVDAGSYIHIEYAGEWVSYAYDGIQCHELAGAVVFHERGSPEPIALSKQELATVLAALRHVQKRVYRRHLLDEYAEFFVDVAPLTDDQIDALCQRLNLGE
jgi:hypothetical protein